MILQAITKLYYRLDEEGHVAKPGFKAVDIPYIIVLNYDGEFVGLYDTREQSGKKLIARSFMVPEEHARSGSRAWAISNLLWDHYGYVLAWPKSESDKDKEMARKQHETFIAEIKKLHDRYPDDRKINSVYIFLTSNNYAAVFNHSSWKDCIKILGCNLTFMIEGDNGIVSDIDNVKEYVASADAESTDIDDADDNNIQEMDGQCLITGDFVPIERLHLRTPIPGAKSNAKIVSFQRNMGFDSYGKVQSFNAPIGKKAAFAYSTALNHLLAKSSRQKLSVADATVVFWAAQSTPLEDVFADLFSEPAKENPEQQNAAIRVLYRASTNELPSEQELAQFYVLGLAPNAARIAIRFWHAGTVKETAQQVKQHFDDCSIVHGPNQPDYLSLNYMLRSTALQGKTENILPKLAGDCMQSILMGTPYPKSALAVVVNRIRAEQSKHDQNGKAIPNVSYPRAAFIKAILCREARYYQKQEMEVNMSLDPGNTNVGYRLGRLFAVLEKIQEEASPGLNATIRNRFYGSASGTPVAAFPHLMKLKNHHLSKLDNRGRATNLEKQVGDIIDGIIDFPAHLNLQDQGRFAVGYYHQRQDFFKKPKAEILEKSQEEKI